ncbi:MAG: hypothetical protein Q3993_00640 [Filifactor alocis]|nr:hypothetical protein [Filifactor alocis]
MRENGDEILSCPSWERIRSFRRLGLSGMEVEETDEKRKVG